MCLNRASENTPRYTTEGSALLNQIRHWSRLQALILGRDAHRSEVSLMLLLTEQFTGFYQKLSAFDLGGDAVSFALR